MYIIEKKGQNTIVRVVPHASFRFRLKNLPHRFVVRAKELWSFRELVRNLVVRDLKVRYKNSVLGIVWSFLNPLLMMVVFTAVFTVMRGEAVNKFPVFVLVGLLPWQFFTNSVSSAAQSIVGNAHLINKVYFPKEILVVSGVLSNLVNLLLSLLVLIPMMALFRVEFTTWAFLLPVMIIIQVIFTLAVCFVVATSNVFYRDVQIILEVVLLAGFFLTPVFYSLDILPHNYPIFGTTIDVWRWMYYLNPMASIIANYRIILYYGASPAFDFLGRTFVTAVVFLIVGLIVFYRYQTWFSEEL